MRRNSCVIATRCRFAEVMSMKKSESREAPDWATWFEQQAPDTPIGELWL